MKEYDSREAAEKAGPPKLGKRAEEAIESSNLHWVLCGGMTVGMTPPRYVWMLRPKNEVAEQQEKTKLLQRLASAARLINEGLTICTCTSSEFYNYSQRCGRWLERVRS